MSAIVHYVFYGRGNPDGKRVITECGKLFERAMLMYSWDLSNVSDGEMFRPEQLPHVRYCKLCNRSALIKLGRGLYAMKPSPHFDPSGGER